MKSKLIDHLKDKGLLEDEKPTHHGIDLTKKLYDSIPKIK